MHLNKKELLLGGFLILMVAIIIWQTYSLATEISTYRRHGYLNPIRVPHRFDRHFNPPTTTPDIIQPWMTFGYINKIYSLPENYLKNALSISDPRYPLLTIFSFSSENKFPLQESMQKIQSLVDRFSTSSKK